MNKNKTKLKDLKTEFLFDIKDLFPKDNKYMQFNKIIKEIGKTFDEYADRFEQEYKNNSEEG